MADGRVVFEVVGDDKDINKTIKGITQNIEKESKKWDASVDESTGNMESSFSAFLKGVAKGFVAAGIGKMLIGLGKDAISAASDLEEVQNVVDVTFGDSAGKIEAWAKSAGKQYGLTETAAKRYTSTIGAMLKSQGMADDEIVQTSTDLAGLAADMASFYNLDFDEAFQKIRSGISGETEPLKQLGINMSVVNLEAFAMEQGITKSFSAMSQGEQTALRYQYIMQATADAQGDFARTADGFANASRRVETAIDTIKTKGGGLLMEVVAPLVSGLADFLNLVTDEGMTTALDDFAAIDASTGAKVSSIQKTAADAGYLTEELEKLAQKANLTGDEQSYWLETCKRLVQTIPGLNAIINTETGEVKGGTDAVREYVKAWEEGQTKLAMMRAVEQKQSALDQRFADLPGLQLDMAVAEKRVRDYKKNLDAIKEKYGLQTDGWDIIGAVSSEAEQEWNSAVNQYFKLINAADKATKAYNEQASAYEEASAALEEYKAVVEDMPGDTKAAADATKEWTTEQKALGQAAVEAAQQALTALADYVQGVHDATEQAVNGIVKGFEAIERPTADLMEKRSKLIQQQNELDRSTKDGEQKYQELQKQIDALNDSMDKYSTNGMQDALQSQLAFMDEYIKNLEKAQQMGLSNELLASLSDGSLESAEYLAGLVSNPEQAKAVDALYQQVQQKKGEFTDALTEQKLSVDETYDAMVAKAQEAVDSLNMGQSAAESMGQTVEGLARGIADHVPDVAEAVDAVLKELNRLNGYGISFSVGPMESVIGGEMLNSMFQLPKHETGLDYVPFDGYLASLHEGESILTAEENRIWQRFKNGAPQGMDYDALGATMRDNVKAGGNVYLDGRVVGSVISDAQGKSYRSLQRSGWQG
jgi:hypothetical protein